METARTVTGCWCFPYMLLIQMEFVQEGDKKNVSTVTVKNIKYDMARSYILCV